MKYTIVGNIGAKDYIEKVFGKLITDEIIVMDERLDHIKKRHAEDFELFKQYLDIAVTNPDYVIKDYKNANTIFMIKKLNNTNLNVVVKIAVDNTDNKYKNSVITFYRIRDKNLNKLIAKDECMILYKRE